MLRSMVSSPHIHHPFSNHHLEFTCLLGMYIRILYYIFCRTDPCNPHSLSCTVTLPTPITGEILCVVALWEIGFIYLCSFLGARVPRSAFAYVLYRSVGLFHTLLYPISATQSLWFLLSLTLRTCSHPLSVVCTMWWPRMTLVYYINTLCFSFETLLHILHTADFSQLAESGPEISDYYTTTLCSAPADSFCQVSKTCFFWL